MAVAGEAMASIAGFFNASRIGNELFRVIFHSSRERSRFASVGSLFETALQCINGRAYAARFTCRRICRKTCDADGKLAPTVHMLSALLSCPFFSSRRCAIRKRAEMDVWNCLT
jgi:hypothetical protein